MTENIRAAIYCRISEDAEGTGLGVARQEQDCRELAARLGAVVVETFTDNDLGASTRSRVKRRPGFEAMMERAQAGEFHYLLAYSNSRLTRRPMEFERLLTLHERTGVRISTVVSGEDDLSTADGRMVARIKASIDAAEAERISERVARKHLQNAREGKPVGGTRPFGWEDDKRTVREAEAALIRKAVADILSGTPIRAISRTWNDAGVTTSTGGTWSPAAVRQLLRSPRLAGWRIHRGKVALDPTGAPVRGQWAPILDDDTHARLVAYMDRPERRSRIPRRDARHYLLTGTLRCGVCNGPMYGGRRPERRTGEMRHYYSCSGAGHVVSIAGDGTDEHIAALALARVQAETLPAVESAQWSGQARLDEISASIRELMDGFTAGRLSSGVVFAAVERLEAERDELQTQRNEWSAVHAGPAVADVTPERWEEMDTDHRRAVIERLFAAVIVRPATRKSNRFDASRLEPVWRDQR